MMLQGFNADASVFQGWEPVRSLWATRL